MTCRLVADAVFTVDADDTMLVPGAVEIDDGLISWVGDPWQVPPAAGTEVHQLGGLLMPGLVNCHGHSPMTLVRSAGDGLPLDRWLHETVWPREALLTDEDVYWGMVLGAAELLCNGTTTTCEQYRHPGPVVEAIVDSGIRATYTPGIFDVSSVWERGHLGAPVGSGVRNVRRHGRPGRTCPSRLRPPRGLHGAAGRTARHRGGGPAARRAAADPPVRDGGRGRHGARALRHERAGTAG